MAACLAQPIHALGDAIQRVVNGLQLRNFVFINGKRQVALAVDEPRVVLGMVKLLERHLGATDFAVALL